MSLNKYFIALACVLLIGFAWHYKPHQKPTFVLLTDFGYDFAVGSIKGVITQKLPDATIIDLDHSIEKFNIVSAGFVLSKTYKYFPKGTCFVCVIDPGVGSKREPICIKTPKYTFIGPNNGLFDEVLRHEKIRTIYEINESYLQPGANTFHGRDLFAPAAVDCYRGDLSKFKPFEESRLTHVINTHDYIAYIDSYGNIKTNSEIDPHWSFGSILSIEINNQSSQIPFVKTFADVLPGQLLCYRGSNSTLEIAVHKGSAAKVLNVRAGDEIVNIGHSKNKRL
jgi:S-adenosylmethionine hydrolase